MLYLMKNLTLLLALAVIGCGGSSVQTNPFKGSYTGVEWTTDQTKTTPIEFQIGSDGMLCGSLHGSVDPSGHLKSQLGDGTLSVSTGGSYTAILAGGSTITTVEVTR